MFIPVCLDEFIEIHLKDHPEEKSNVLRIKLESAIEAYLTGKKYSCGNDIWVAGSASNGLSAFNVQLGSHIRQESMKLTQL